MRQNLKLTLIMNKIFYFLILIIVTFACSNNDQENVRIENDKDVKTTQSAIEPQGNKYDFASYPAEIKEITKAKLNLESHPLGNTFKTEITNQYNTGKINFGGHYVLTFWGAGMGLTQGAMIDAKTGNIFELPLTEDNSMRNCVYNDNENIFHRPNSNLFATFKCDRTNEEGKLNLTYFYYKWNGKEFNLIGKRQEQVIEK